jgi:hypothetical protein
VAERQEMVCELLSRGARVEGMAYSCQPAAVPRVSLCCTTGRPLWRDRGLDASRGRESRRERSPEEDDERSAMWKCSERATLLLACKPALDNGVSDFKLSTIGSFDLSNVRQSTSFLVDCVTGGVCRWCRLRYRLTDNSQCELLLRAWAPLPALGAAAHVLS